MVLTTSQQEIVAKVVHYFLETKEPTPKLSLIKKFRNPDAIDKLEPVALKLDESGNLWPRVLAFECSGDLAAVRSARHATEVVIHVLQDLFNDEKLQKADFTIEEVEQRQREILGAAERETINLSLYLIQEFREIHAGLAGCYPNFTWVRIHPRICLLNNIPSAWDNYVSSYSVYLQNQ